jgi:hypothetical protein
MRVDSDIYELNVRHTLTSQTHLGGRLDKTTVFITINLHSTIQVDVASSNRVSKSVKRAHISSNGLGEDCADYSYVSK